MRVLVIFDLIPEETKQAIVEMSNEEYQFFSKAHNVIVNASDDEEGIDVANVISWAFSIDQKHKKYCVTDAERKYFGQWTNDLDVQDIADVSKVIYSGFYL